MQVARVAPLLASILTLGWACSPESATGPESTTESGSTPGTRPDVLLVVVDDLSWTDLDAIETPVLDRLAGDGLRFEGMYAASPSCSPFRGSLLFGIRPDRAAIGRPILPRGGNAKHPDLADEDNPMFPDSLTSLADIAGKASYRSAAFGKSHLANDTVARPEDYMRRIGFDQWRAGGLYGVRNYGGVDSGARTWMRIDNGVIGPETAYNPTVITDEVVDWWNETPGPRLAYVAHNLPHAPFHVPNATGGRRAQDNRSRFEAMVRELDRQLGRLLAGIGFFEAPEDTLLVVVSDNGTPPNVVGERREGRVKPSVYEDGVRVPMIVCGWETAGDGRRTPAGLIASSTDFLATFAELWGVAIPGDAAQDSQSFLDALLEEDVETARDVVFSQFWEPNGVATAEKDPCRYMVRHRDGRKLIREGRVADEAGRWELYDLTSDPDEREPRDGEGAHELRATLVELARW